MFKRLVSALAVVLILAGTSQAVLAAPVARCDSEEEVCKVAICHGDNNVQQPYGPKQIEVNVSGANGVADHAGHTGPVATSEVVAQGLKDAKIQWGDIIPPNDSLPLGLNWTPDGQAIWNNNCQYVVVTPPVTPPTPGRGGDPEVVTTPAPQVTAVPAQGVSAGAGGSTGSAVPALVAMSGSLLTLAYGVVRFRKFNG